MTIPQDIRRALSVYKNIAGALGAIITVVSLANFFTSVFSLPVSELLEPLLQTYVAIVHGFLGFLFGLLGIRLPWFVFDLIFVYSVLGAAAVRSRTSFGYYYLDEEGAGGFIKTLKESYRSQHRSLAASIWEALPKKGRIAFDYIFWPRVIMQVFALPRVHFNHYYGWSKAYPRNMASTSSKPFEYDRRWILFWHIMFILICVAFILIVNGFLVVQPA